MKIDISEFDTIEEFCKNFSYMHGCLRLSYLYENWTDYVYNTFSKQEVIDNCEDYDVELNKNNPIACFIEGLYNEEEYDSYLDDD